MTRVRSQHGVVVRSAFTTIVTLLIELAGTHIISQRNQRINKGSYSLPRDKNRIWKHKYWYNFSEITVLRSPGNKNFTPLCFFPIILSLTQQFVFVVPHSAQRTGNLLLRYPGSPRSVPSHPHWTCASAICRAWFGKCGHGAILLQSKTTPRPEIANDRRWCRLSFPDIGKFTSQPSRMSHPPACRVSNAHPYSPPLARWRKPSFASPPWFVHFVA